MQRDYRYTVYVLALAALVTLATAGLTVAGSASTSDPAGASLSNTDIDIVDHDDALTDEEADELVDLVREIEPLQEQFDGVDSLQFDVHQSKALDDGEFVPIEDEYDVRVSPPDERLPQASLSVNLDESALVIDDTVEPLDDVSVTVDDDDGLLSDDEADTLESALLDGGDVAYQIQTLLGEPDAIEVAIGDRDGDDVDAEVTVDEGSETIHATVDVDEGTVIDHHIQMQFETDGGETVEFEEGTFAVEVGAENGEETPDSAAEDIEVESVETVEFDVVETDDGSDDEFYIEIDDEDSNDETGDE